MQLPKHNSKELDKETMDRFADIIFSQTPEEKEAAEKSINKTINDNIQLMIDRGYDVTELVNVLNTPKK